MFSDLYDFVSAIVLFLFVIHYFCYIIQTLSSGVGGSNTVEQSESGSNNCRATDKQVPTVGANKSTRSVAMQSEDAKYIQK